MGIEVMPLSQVRNSGIGRKICNKGQRMNKFIFTVLLIQRIPTAALSYLLDYFEDLFLSLRGQMKNPLMNYLGRIHILIVTQNQLPIASFLPPDWTAVVPRLQRRFLRRGGVCFFEMRSNLRRN